METPRDVLLNMSLEHLTRVKQAHTDGHTNRIYGELDFFQKDVTEIIEATEDKKSLKKVLKAIRANISPHIFNIFK